MECIAYRIDFHENNIGTIYNTFLFNKLIIDSVCLKGDPQYLLKPNYSEVLSHHKLSKSVADRTPNPPQDLWPTYSPQEYNIT